MLRKKLSIAYLIIIVLTTVISVVMVLFIYMQIRQERKSSYSQLRNKLEVYSSQISNSLALPLWNYDIEQISQIMQSQMKDPEIFAITISEAGKDVVLHSKIRNQLWQVIDSKVPAKKDKVLFKTYTIEYEKKQLGNVTVYVTTNFVEEQLKQKFNYSLLMVIILILLLSLGLFIMLWFIVIKPVKSIGKYAVAVSTGDIMFEPTANSNYSGELFELNGSINQMVDILNQRYSALQETEERYRNLFENTPISIWLEDISGIFEYFESLELSGAKDIEQYFLEHPDDFYKCLSLIKVIEVNKASCKLFKAKDNNDLIENLAKLFTNEAIEVFKKGLFTIMGKKDVFESESELITLEGETCYVIVKWNLVNNYKGKKHLLVSISDITKQKKYEIQLLENERELKLTNEEYLTLNEELSESNQRILRINEELQISKEKAEESNQLKTAFLCNMSHEIRTPLNAIVGFSDLLSEADNVSDKTARNISIIQKSSNQLLSIVNDILTISRIQTGQEIIITVPINVNHVLDHLFEIFTPIATEKKLDFILKKGVTEPEFRIQTDETKFIQIITNLLSNSFKFTPKGSIEFGYSVNENKILFYVKDTGIGISYEAQKIIFDRFRQADISISTKYGGTGLGLSISKAFAEMLGGTIIVESEPNNGAIFTLSIPYMPVRPIRKHEAQKSVILANTATILVAEDEEFNYSLIEEIFSSTNYTIKRAKNGIEAVEICNTEEIDLVLMDIKMPDMDGVTALNKIRLVNKLIPVVAQTAYALEQEKQLLLEQGFNDYLSKPIKPKILVEMVNRILNAR